MKPSIRTSALTASWAMAGARPCIFSKSISLSIGCPRFCKTKSPLSLNRISGLKSLWRYASSARHPRRRAVRVMVMVAMSQADHGGYDNGLPNLLSKNFRRASYSSSFFSCSLGKAFSIGFLGNIGSHSRVVHESGHDHGCLLQIIGLQAVVDVHIRVMGTRLVLDGILDELETGNADGVERQMVRTTRVAHSDGVHAQVVKRQHPGLKYGLDRGIFLKIDAANFSRAVINIEVSRDFGLFRLHRDRTGLAPKQSWHSFHVGLVHGRTRPEVLLYIALRPEQALLLAAP